MKKELCNKGFYMKVLTLGEEILTFRADSEDDNSYRLLQEVQKINPKFCAYQCCEDGEERERKFSKIFYPHYNYYGDLKGGLLIEFDFKNNLLYAGEYKYKLKEDKLYEFTYKIQKTQIKAIDGLQGFYNFIVKSMHIGNVFNGSTYNLIKKKLYRIEE